MNNSVSFECQRAPADRADRVRREINLLDLSTAQRTYIILLGLALLACLAAGKQDEGGKQAGSLAAKLLPSQYKVRHSRSLGDMFEKMRSKIFGSRKVTSSPGQGSSAASTSQLQTSASANSAQRQPWGDVSNQK